MSLGKKNRRITITLTVFLAVPTSPTQLPPPRIPSPQDPNETPAQLPTPAPSHPSYSIPQISALESRITHLESSEIASRLSKVEDSLNLLQSPLIELPLLKDLFGVLQTANKDVESRVSQLSKIHAELETRAVTLENQVKELLADNMLLKRKISELENAKQATENVPKTGVVTNLSKDGRQERESGDDLSNPDPNLCVFFLLLCNFGTQANQITFVVIVHLCLGIHLLPSLL